MKYVMILSGLLVLSLSTRAENEIGPEGYKLFWFAGFILVLFLIIVFNVRSGKIPHLFRQLTGKRKRVSVDLKKDRLYYPDFLELTIRNTGNTDVDIDKPVLIFSSIWLKRKFVIKGTGNYHFYPLYLNKGQSHTLAIDLNRFYRHDKTLKRLPGAKVVVNEVGGKKLGSCKVLLRKTLIGF